MKNVLFLVIYNIIYRFADTIYLPRVMLTEQHLRDACFRVSITLFLFLQGCVPASNRCRVRVF